MPLLAVVPMVLHVVGRSKVLSILEYWTAGVFDQLCDIHCSWVVEIHSPSQVYDLSVQLCIVPSQLHYLSVVPLL